MSQPGKIKMKPESPAVKSQLPKSNTQKVDTSRREWQSPLRSTSEEPVLKSMTPEDLLRIQNIYGNQAVGQLLAGEQSGLSVAMKSATDAGRINISSSDASIIQREETEYDTKALKDDVKEDRQKLDAAWEIIKNVSATPVQPEEIKKLGEILKEAQLPQSLNTSMLSRLENIPNTKVVVKGDYVKSYGDEGTTRLMATYNNQTYNDENLGIFKNFVHSTVPPSERSKVQFKIEVKILVPKASARQFLPETDIPTLGSFVETLNHEFSLHAEHYAEQIEKYRRGEPWGDATATSEHREHLVEGNPRYVQNLHRLHQSKGKGHFSDSDYQNYTEALKRSVKAIEGEHKKDLNGKKPISWFKKFNETDNK
jgi:hypothetical protein